MCFGAGTMTLPYVYYLNGPILSTVLICLSGYLSYYTGYLLTYAAEMTGGKSMEEIAFKLYGINGLRITSVSNLLTNIGFLLNFVILFKTTMPVTLVYIGITPPDWLANNFTGKSIWDTIFVFVLLTPLCIPRDLSALRFTSLVAFALSLFLTISVIGMCFVQFDYEGKDPKESQKSIGERSKKAFETGPNFLGIISSLSYLILSYMY